MAVYLYACPCERLSMVSCLLPDVTALAPGSPASLKGKSGGRWMNEWLNTNTAFVALSKNKLWLFIICLKYLFTFMCMSSVCASVCASSRFHCSLPWNVSLGSYRASHISQLLYGFIHVRIWYPCVCLHIIVLRSVCTRVCASVFVPGCHIVCTDEWPSQGRVTLRKTLHSCLVACLFPQTGTNMMLTWWCFQNKTVLCHTVWVLVGSLDYVDTIVLICTSFLSYVKTISPGKG